MKAVSMMEPSGSCVAMLLVRFSSKRDDSGCNGSTRETGADDQTSWSGLKRSRGPDTRESKGGSMLASVFVPSAAPKERFCTVFEPLDKVKKQCTMIGKGQVRWLAKGDITEQV